MVYGTFVSMPATAAEENPSVFALRIKEEGRFSELQQDRVRAWIREVVPECPRAVALRAVDSFLMALHRESPTAVELVNAPDFPVRRYQSLLLREVGVQLTGIEETALREEVARRRVVAVLSADSVVASSQEESARLFARIKEMASIHSRRLFEGRMEDDELVVLLKKARAEIEPAAAPAELAPKELTAAEIISKYVRLNQEGSALQRLRALTVEGRMRTATGEELEVLLYKLRPDRFRMTLRAEGTTRFVNGYDGRQYWQQRRGEAPITLQPEALGNGRHLGEFSDPLYQEQAATFARLEDRDLDGVAVYRIAVQRRDGSSHVAWIDTDSFEQIGREMPDKSIIRYSDFRRVMGVRVAFREEATDAAGNKTVLLLSRATGNPGLIPAFFEIPDRSRGPFHWDGLLRTASASTLKP